MMPGGEMALLNGGMSLKLNPFLEGITSHILLLT
jgi:hypothetical protein